MSVWVSKTLVACSAKTFAVTLRFCSVCCRTATRSCHATRANSKIGSSIAQRTRPLKKGCGIDGVVGTRHWRTLGFIRRLHAGDLAPPPASTLANSVVELIRRLLLISRSLNTLKQRIGIGAVTGYRTHPPVA